MKINRIKKENNFVVLATHAIRNEKLSWGAKGLHSFIMQLPSDFDLNLEGLKKFSTVGRDGTAALMKELIEAGYVTREKLKSSGGKFSGYEYNIYEYPQITENGKPVYGDAENGFSVYGDTENGKPDTIKYEDKDESLSNKELNNSLDKNEKSFLQNNRQDPIVKKEEKDKEEKSCAKKEETLSEEQQQFLLEQQQNSKILSVVQISASPTPNELNDGVFYELRAFAIRRQNSSTKSKKLTHRAWKMMQNQCIEAQKVYGEQLVLEWITYAISTTWQTPFWDGWQERFLKRNNIKQNENYSNQPTNTTTTSQKLGGFLTRVQGRTATKNE